jgi:hypothetical protein
MRIFISHGTYAHLRSAIRAAGGKMSGLNVLKRRGMAAKSQVRGVYLIDTSRPIPRREIRR